MKKYYIESISGHTGHKIANLATTYVGWKKGLIFVMNASKCIATKNLIYFWASSILMHMTDKTSEAIYSDTQQVMHKLQELAIG